MRNCVMPICACSNNNRSAWLEQWKEGTDPRNTPAEQYLGMQVPRELTKAVLRFHPQKRALLSLLRFIGSDQPAGMQVLYLHPHGIAKPYQYGRAKGAAVKFGQASPWLYICESVALALKAYATGRAPIWVLPGAAFVQMFSVVECVTKLVILRKVNPSRASIEAAQICAERWRLARREVLITDYPQH